MTVKAASLGLSTSSHECAIGCESPHPPHPLTSRRLRPRDAVLRPSFAELRSARLPELGELGRSAHRIAPDALLCSAAMETANRSYRPPCGPPRHFLGHRPESFKSPFSAAGMAELVDAMDSKDLRALRTDRD